MPGLKPKRYVVLALAAEDPSVTLRSVSVAARAGNGIIANSAINPIKILVI
jgi:hypothetical protein